MPSTRPSAPTVAAVPRTIGDNRADRAPAPSGPVVRVTRGKDTVEVPVGTK